MASHTVVSMSERYAGVFTNCLAVQTCAITAVSASVLTRTRRDREKSPWALVQRFLLIFSLRLFCIVYTLLSSFQFVFFLKVFVNLF